MSLWGYIEKLHILFNKILDSGHYPEYWNEGIIFYIQKAGARLDPNNYRRISLPNGLGNFFNSMLYKHLQDKIEK